MAKGNKGLLRLIKDEESFTGLSAAILLRHVRPRKISGGNTLIAKSDFIANFKVNCDGYRVRPRVITTIECQLSAAQVREARRKKLLDRAMSDSPMLK